MKTENNNKTSKLVFGPKKGRKKEKEAKKGSDSLTQKYTFQPWTLWLGFHPFYSL